MLRLLDNIVGVSGGLSRDRPLLLDDCFSMISGLHVHAFSSGPGSKVDLMALSPLQPVACRLPKVRWEICHPDLCFIPPVSLHHLDQVFSSLLHQDTWPGQ